MYPDVYSSNLKNEMKSSFVPNFMAPPSDWNYIKKYTMNLQQQSKLSFKKKKQRTLEVIQALSFSTEPDPSLEVEQRELRCA